MSVYLGNGQGGFSAPTSYNAGPDPTGLTVADLENDGNLDLLVGNAFGDVLVLRVKATARSGRYRDRPQIRAWPWPTLRGMDTRTSSTLTRTSTT